jgi:hypothetical protein
MPSSAHDIAILDDLPPVRIWGESLDEIDQQKVYRGKFVVTSDGKFFAKLYPAREWEGIEFFHDMLVRELGVKAAESMDVKEAIVGGGKIDLELTSDGVECRLFGKSTIYGDYDPLALDTEAIASEIQEVFDLGDTPVEVIPDYEP